MKEQRAAVEAPNNRATVKRLRRLLRAARRKMHLVGRPCYGRTCNYTMPDAMADFSNSRLCGLIGEALCDTTPAKLAGRTERNRR